MGSEQLGLVLRHLRTLTGASDYEAATDHDLLERFAVRRDEPAFAALLQRYGPLVLGVCRRVLQHHHDAEDAFQATFLVLARKAAAIRRRESLPGWLYEVAYHVALRARANRGKRRQHERQAEQMAPAELTTEDAWQQLWPVLDEELHRLPEKYRTPLVLCYLQGRTQVQAAQELGLPAGSMSRRLARAKELLRERLAQRGVALSAALLAAVLADKATAATVPALLVLPTLRAAVLYATGKSAAGGTAAGAASLADAVLRSAFLGKVKLTLLLLLTVSLLAGGAGVLARPMLTAEKDDDPIRTAQPAAAPREQPQAAQEPPRTDHDGNLLPEGAIARLGTTRLRHGGGILAGMDFTPDGKALVSQGGDGVRTWDVATGKQLHFFPKESEHFVWGAGSLSGDGQRLAMPARSGIHVWDLGTGQSLRIVGEGNFSSVRLSPDGKLAAGHLIRRSERFVTSELFLYDVATGQELLRWKAGQEGFSTFAFTADGKTLITAGGQDKHAIGFWSVARGEVQRQINTGTGNPGRIALSPDGTLLAALCHHPTWIESRIGIWRVATGEQVRQLRPPAKENVTSRSSYYGTLTFSPDGKAVFATGLDEAVLAWDIATGEQLHRVGRGMNNGGAVAVSPDGRTLAMSYGPIIRLIDLATGQDVFPEIASQLQVNAALVTADGRTAVTADPHRIVVWDVMTARPERQLEFQDEFPVPIRMIGDGRQFLVWGWDGAGHRRIVHVYELATGKELQRREFPDTVGNLVALAPDGKTLALSRDDGSIVLIDWSTGLEMHRLVHRRPGQEAFARGTFTIGGRRLVVWDESRQVRVWDTATGRLLHQLKIDEEVVGPAPRPNGIAGSYHAAVSPDGQWLAVAGRWLTRGGVKRRMALYEVGTGQLRYTVDEPPDDTSTLIFSPLGKVLAWGGTQDGTVHLLDAATGQEQHRLHGHKGRIASLSFSADGKLLISGGADATAVVWDLTGTSPEKAGGSKPPSPAD